MQMDAEKILAENRDEIRDKMKDLARRGEIVYYAQLFGFYGLDMSDKHFRQQLMPDFLGVICREEHEAGRHLLTVVVCLKEDDEVGDVPSKGFYNLAEELGFPINGKSDREAKVKFAKKQRALLQEYWKNHPKE